MGSGKLESFGQVVAQRFNVPAEIVGIGEEEAAALGLREAVLRRMVRQRLRSGATRFVAWLAWTRRHPGEERLLALLDPLWELVPLLGCVVSVPALWATPGLVAALAGRRGSREVWLEGQTSAETAPELGSLVVGARQAGLPVVLAFPLPADPDLAQELARSLGAFRPWGIRFWPVQWEREEPPPPGAAATVEAFLAAAAAFVTALPPTTVLRLVGRQLPQERFGGPAWLTRASALRRRLQAELRRRGLSQGSALLPPS